MESKTEKVLKVLDKLYEKEKKYSSKDPALVKKYQKQYSNNFMFDAWKGVHPVLNVSIGDKYDWRKDDYWVFEKGEFENRWEYEFVFDHSQVIKDINEKLSKLKEAQEFDERKREREIKREWKANRLSNAPEPIQEFRKELFDATYRSLLSLKAYYAKYDTEKQARLAGESVSAYVHFEYATDEDLRREAKNDADAAILDLMNRVYEKAGEIVKCIDWTISKGRLNGIIEGTKGSVSVESVFAGGYNIQRPHVRTLVKPIVRVNAKVRLYDSKF